MNCSITLVHLSLVAATDNNMNFNHVENIYNFQFVEQRKRPCIYYIDDRCIRAHDSSYGPHICECTDIHAGKIVRNTCHVAQELKA